MPSVNPRIVLRQFQAKEQCVWLAVYDDDLKQDLFAVKIANCSDQQLPSEFCSYYLEEFEPYLLNSNSVCLRRCDAIDRLFGGSVPGALTRLYLVKLSQLFDVVHIKNYQATLLSKL